MKPIKFPQANLVLQKPPSMTDEECQELHVYRRQPGAGADDLISCWRPSWRERLAIFFGRPVWLWVFGRAHPPVALEVYNPFAEPPGPHD